MTDDTPVYLRQDLQLEPLINHWYAWALSVAPATAALNVADHQIRILRSYVNAPQVHAAAVRNPAMQGGPFVDLDASRAGLIRELLARTEADQRHVIELAEAMRGLNELLLREAKGQALDALYPRIPDALRGYVELVYDLNGRPQFRVLEPLLYRSRYYDPALQQIAASLATEAGRPFVFSTPRFEGEGRLHLNLPFADPRLDQLARLRWQPQPLGFVRDLLGLTADQLARFRGFVTDEAPPVATRYQGEGVRARYLGHACLLFETRDVTVMVDPIIGYRSDPSCPSPQFSDLPPQIDYVLLTHAHSDHVVLETLLQLRHRLGTIIVPRSGGSLEDPSLKLMLRQLGFGSVIEIDELEEVELGGGGSVVGIPFLGEHGDLNIRSKTAHLLRLGGTQMLCTADSCALDPRLYEHVHAAVGDVDVLFLGMECDGAPLSWMYGGLMLSRLDRKADQSRRLSASDCNQAMEIVRKFHAHRVYVYAMGAEPWLSFITSIHYTEQSKPIVESNRLVESCGAAQVPARRLFGTQELALSRR